MLLEGKRILILDDNEENILVIRNILQSEGAHVQVDWWWTDGEVDRIKNALPLDIILLDIMLSGNRDGFDVFEDIRTAFELNDVPIVAVSASDPNIAMNKARNLGFMGFISKPVDFETLPRMVAKVLDGTQVWDDDLV